MRLEQVPIESFAGKVKALRKGRGLTIRELAEAICVSNSTIARWENGASPACSRETLQLLADFFNVPIGYFVDNRSGIDRILEGSEIIKKLMGRVSDLEHICNAEYAHNGHPEGQ